MKDEQEEQRSIEDIVQSTSDNLFPDELGGKIVDLDSRANDGDTPLHVLIWRGDDEGAEALIDAGADLNAIGDMGSTPLHVAARQKNHRLLKKLIDSGADPTITDEFHKTPQQIISKKEKEK